MFFLVVAGLLSGSFHPARDQGKVPCPGVSCIRVGTVYASLAAGTRGAAGPFRARQRLRLRRGSGWMADTPVTRICPAARAPGRGPEHGVGRVPISPRALAGDTSRFPSHRMTRIVM